jgi:oxygen-independent coproporphyrinogen-3 oxidase
VQDFDPVVQRAVRRIQSVEETRAMIDYARQLGYGSINLDLIYGLPHQTPETFRRTIAQIVELGPDRVALFSFAYVPSMKPHQRRLPIAAIPSGPAKFELYRAAHDRLVDAGYRAIGMDHFALPGDELARAQERGELWRDFQGYTTLRAADTVAVGMTGISDVGGAYAQNEHVLSTYEAAVDSGRLATQRGCFLSDDDRRRRAAITSLMCNFRLPLDEDARRSYAPELAALAPLVDDGLVELAPDAVAVTPLGRPFVRNVAMVFDAYLRRGGARAAFSRTV